MKMEDINELVITDDTSSRLDTCLTIIGDRTKGDEKKERDTEIERENTNRRE